MPKAPALPVAAAPFPPVPAGPLLLGIRTVTGWTEAQLARALGWTTARVKVLAEGREEATAEELDLILRAAALDRGGSLPRRAEPDPSWEAFQLSLQIGQVVYRYFSLIGRTGKRTAGEKPE